MKWTKKGFEEFRKGTFGNGGQNLYVSAKGVLQRLYNFDINGDGYVDIPFANAHSMFEKPPLHIYDSLDQAEPLKLPSNGSFDAIFTDLTGDGTEDLIVACQHNGVHTDISAIIYYASEQGLCEKYKRELRVPNSFGVAAGDFNGSGKKALAFISKDKLRVFYQTELGIESSKFEELDIAGITLAAGDLDGDGFDDLYVLHQETGELAVYWGGEDGLKADRKTVFGKPTVTGGAAVSTTAGRKLYRWVPWKNSVLNMGDKVMTFRAEDNYAVFETFDKNRQPHEELRVCCAELITDKDYDSDAVFEGYGPMNACVGDLKNNGGKDIVIAVATDFEKIDDVLVLWEDKNYSLEHATRIPVMTARSVDVGPVGDNGKNLLYIALSSKRDELDVPAKVFEFDRDGNATEVREFMTHECVRLMSGKTFTDGRYQIVAVNHEGEFKLGLENAQIFLGGEDGYDPERYLLFPTHAGVDTTLVDLTDNGYPDVLCANSGENAIELNPGAVVYWNGPDGFDTENKFHEFISTSAHGCAVGDFRHSGYLDVITGGIHMRDIQIYEGGPDGYPAEKTKRLIMGPDPDNYVSRNDGNTFGQVWADDPAARLEFGEVRWLFTADFNNDGWLDLFVSQICGSRSFIFWGGPEGFSTERMQEIATDGISAANAADLDGDGYLDLIVSSHQSLKHTIPNEYGKFVIYWGSKDGYSENRRTELPTHCSNALTIQDFNGDGLLDIYGTAYNNGRLRDIDSKLYFQTEDRMFHIDNFQFIFNNSGCGCLAGDFNGDGYIDLAVASHKKNGNHVCDSYIFWGGEDGINENRYTALPTRGPHGMHSVDIGNIMDRTDSEYYTSEAYKTDLNATKVSWEATNGKKTWVKIQFRCAETADSLEKAEWSESFENGADISSLNLTGYIQYKLELGAYCGTGTPRVTEVTVEFE